MYQGDILAYWIPSYGDLYTRVHLFSSSPPYQHSLNPTSYLDTFDPVRTNLGNGPIMLSASSILPFLDCLPSYGENIFLLKLIEADH